MAEWTKVMGEGIYATRPWLTYGELEPGESLNAVESVRKGHVYDDPTRVKMGRLKVHEGDIRYTQSKDGKTIYAARLSWPEKSFTLRSFAEDGVGKGVKVASISLLGSKADCKWKRTEVGITVTPPEQGVFENPSWPVVFRIETK
jgi:alpha-L-fucosidase